MKALLLVLMLFASVQASARPPAPVASMPPAAPASQPVLQSQSQSQSQGQIESAAAVADPDFGIHANVLGLERRVEMLQWRKVNFPAPPHDEQAWIAGRVDANGLDAAHKNPDDLPFNGARWWSGAPKLDGHPVAASVLGALDAWAPLRPVLSQLPTNLAVSFQPDGDWLSTSQDPAHPQVGDVRVRWRVIEHASAPAGTTLIAGRWELPAATQPAPTTPTATSLPSSGIREWMQRLFGNYVVWLFVAGLVLALALLIWKRRR